MKNASGGTQPVRAALLAFGIGLAAPAAAQEPTAESYILPTADKQCDQSNRSWVVASRHTQLSIKVVVKWSALGAKEMQEEIVLSPGKSRAIGCASELQIVSAEIMPF